MILWVRSSNHSTSVKCLAWLCMPVTPSLRALSQADPGNSLSSQPRRNSQLQVQGSTPSWGSKVKSDEGRHLISPCGLYTGTGGCSYLCTHVYAPHICIHQKEKKNIPTQNAATITITTTCCLLWHLPTLFRNQLPLLSWAFYSSMHWDVWFAVASGGAKTGSFEVPCLCVPSMLRYLAH